MSASRFFVVAFMLGCRALAMSSNWARVTTVLHSPFAFAAAVLVAGASHMPVIVMTAVSGAVPELSGAAAFSVLAAVEAAGALREVFGEEAGTACPSASEATSRTGRQRQRINKLISSGISGCIAS